MSLGFLTWCGIRGLIRLHQEMHTYALGNGYMIYIYIIFTYTPKKSLFSYRNVLKGEGLKVRSKCPLPPRHHVTSPSEPLETVAWHGYRVCLRTILPPKNSMFLLKKVVVNQSTHLPPSPKQKKSLPARAGLTKPKTDAALTLKSLSSAVLQCPVCNF